MNNKQDKLQEDQARREQEALAERNAREQDERKEAHEENQAPANEPKRDDAFNSIREGQTVGEPPRNVLGERTDVPLAPSSVPNVPNPSNDPKHPSQPSGTYVPGNPANFNTPMSGDARVNKAEGNDEDEKASKKSLEREGMDETDRKMREEALKEKTGENN